MPFARPHFSEILKALDFILIEDYPLPRRGGSLRGRIPIRLLARRKFEGDSYVASWGQPGRAAGITDTGKSSQGGDI